MIFLDRFIDISENYDTFFLDQFGVIHDGLRVYPGVVEVLTDLQSLGKEVCLISNSGRRGDYNRQRNKHIGLGPDLYQRIMTSGDALNHLLTDQNQDYIRFNGRRIFSIHRETGPDLENTGFTFVDSINDADFIVLDGLPNSHEAQAQYYNMLPGALANNLMLVCANPDRVMITDRGLLPGAGEMAQKYEAMGGQVVYVGKPYPLIYRLLLAEKNRGRILCVGDSIEHDIAGAAGMEMDSMLILGGIYRKITQNMTESQAAAFIEEQCQRLSITRKPAFVMGSFA